MKKSISKLILFLLTIITIFSFRKNDDAKVGALNPIAYKRGTFIFGFYNYGNHKSMEGINAVFTSGTNKPYA